MGTQFDTSGQDILYKSNLRTPYLILYVKVQKLYHFYTVPTSYLYRFFDFYITSISLKFSVITDAISYLYHFSDFYIIAISWWTSVISILYRCDLPENYHDKTKFSQKIRTVSRPYITSHIYHFPLHNLLCRNPNIIYKPNHFIDPFTFHFDKI